MMSRKLIDELHNDFNDLAVEARNSRSQGLTGQISGLFVSGQHRDVKEKAEAAQVALRDICEADDVETACRACSVRRFPSAQQADNWLLKHHQSRTRRFFLAVFTPFFCWSACAQAWSKRVVSASF